eukprot:TRINITY_DN7848_c0_g1_i1.p1 TRINITY_DN7848_c0_g1~~TRINITY_DN7848_c0_g1_i1.p1  ORF type:complete len:230 (-),score=61.62 TRINITY_DN7848_c0_g1_i1:57-746(-)
MDRSTANAQSGQMTQSTRLQGEKLTLAYWNVRWRAEPIKMLLEFLRLDYEFKPITDGAQWAEEKKTFKNDFPNLPYLTDGRSFWTETESLIFNICHRANRQDLLGRNEEDIVILRAIRGVITDLSDTASQAARGLKRNREESLAAIRALDPKLEQIAKFLGQKQFLTGDITYCDFLLFELISFLQTIDPTLIERYPNLISYIDRFASIPSIAEFLKSPRHTARFQHQAP